jgi:NAD(P)-dependent dehydrogenase (short-subunit alcohol dehydrogenase family)
MSIIENQIAVVTGAGRGIGRAIAIELGRLGAQVILAARSRTELEETAGKIGANAALFQPMCGRRTSFTGYSIRSSRRLVRWTSS